MDSLVVLDASALLAILHRESGAERVAKVLSRSILSSVNLAEVQTKLVLEGMDERIAWWHIAALNCPVDSFNEEQARIAGSLVRLTKPFGLSLGDRACLALGIARKAVVYTADREWLKLGLDLEIVTIR